MSRNRPTKSGLSRTQVGTVPVYTQDVTFCAFNWFVGQSQGTKQTAITQATLMAFTSMPMPMLMAEPGPGRRGFFDGPPSSTPVAE